MSTSRTIRRALERKQARAAGKQARNEAQSAAVAADPLETGMPLISKSHQAFLASLDAEYISAQDEGDIRDSRREINRLNARYSTGPTSSTGKATSSMNALKTGLTGRTVLLPDDDAAAYESHIARFVAEHKPVGDRESELVQSLADSRWRLNRIPSLESGIYALGRIQFADLFPSYEPAIRAALIQAHTHLNFQKQLNNLALQEARLRRHFEKDLAELQRLQAERIRTAAKPPAADKPARTAAAPQIGFEFSTAPQSSNEAVASDPSHSDSGSLLAA